MTDDEINTFHVPDMTCGHCAATIRGALEKVLPQGDVEIDVSAATVRVKGNATVAEQAIRGAGYTPKPS